MTDAASLGVTPASGASALVQAVYNSVFPTRSAASFVGGLSQDNTDISVMSQLSQNIGKNFYTFNFEQGSTIKLGFNSTVGYLGDSNGDLPGTTVDGVAAGLRFQLYDVTGNLIADSAGTPDQQAAYASLNSDTGLTAANGGYYVQVSAAPGTTLSNTNPAAYNFQLYSGTTYATSLVYSAQTQSYDPNLFVSASDSVSSVSSSLNLYTNVAALSGKQASALNIGKLDANKSELDVVSKLNEQNQASYYKFNFDQGTALKLALTNSTSSAIQQQLRVQLYDTNGKLIADSSGNDAQQQAYTKLASGEGLTAANGEYTVKVSYAPGSLTSSTQSYNFQVLSGTGYDTVYKTTANFPSATDAGRTPDVGIFANSQAQLYTRQAYNTIGATANGAINVGYLQQNQSALNIVSQLTHADNADFYNFTLQQGNNLKLAFNNQTNTTTARIQLLDPTGTAVLADNFGTKAQQAAFAQLTSPDGLKASPQQYVVKVGYAPSVDTSKTQTYDFQIYSGDTYNNVYKTTASAQSLQNALLSGNTKVVGYNPASASANYLESILGGSNSTVNLLGDLAALV